MTTTIHTGDWLDVLPAMGPPYGGFNCVLADPPFNLGKDYGGGVDDRMDPADYAQWLTSLYADCYRVAADNSVLYGFCGADDVPVARAAIKDGGWEYVQMLIWYGPNGFHHRPHGGKIWAVLYEPIVYAIKGAGLPRSDPMPWYHAVLIVPRPQSNHRAGRFHVCQKPVRLYSLLLAAHEGIARVLDPTCGSGSSLVACVERDIPAVGIEIVPETAQLARNRVAAALSGRRYAVARTGQTALFEENDDD